MKYSIRKAQTVDLSRILEIYEYARAFMVKTGNPHQWGNHTPYIAQLERDIGEEKLYLICEDESIRGVFFFDIGPDPTYSYIEDGQWRKDAPYGVIHRIAGDGSGRILHTAVSFARSKADYLRIDTHHDNKVMQNALAKQGFERCGIIYLENGDPRIAFDYIAQ